MHRYSPTTIARGVPTADVFGASLEQEFWQQTRRPAKNHWLKLEEIDDDRKWLF